MLNKILNENEIQDNHVYLLYVITDQCDRTTRPSEGAGAVGSWSCAISGQSEVCSVTCRVPPPDTATITCNLTNGANVWKNTTKFCSVRKY